MLKKILKWSGIFFENISIYIFFLGLMAFSCGLGFRGKYQRIGKYSIELVVAGLIIMLPYIIFYLYKLFQFKRVKDAKDLEHEKQFSEFLKKASQKNINTDQIEIFRFNGKTMEQLEAIAERHNKNSSENYVELRIKNNNKIIDYSFYTSKNLDNVKIHFLLQKEIIYYQYGNQKYIDLDFLNQ